MGMRITEAWVLHAGAGDPRQPVPGELKLEPFELRPLGPGDVLTEPIYGCWEANMDNAIARRPIDVCRDRNEPRVVLGNAGVVRVLEVGSSVSSMRPGDMCMVYGNSEPDANGYPTRALAYDAPHTMGVLARQSVLYERDLIPLPQRSRLSLRQWAAFSVRYVTAWGNWRVAFGCWKVQMSDEDAADAHVWGWGGGTALGELLLARQHGFNTAMIASTDERLSMISRLGIEAIDRREFAGLVYDEARMTDDPEYRARYSGAEKKFLAVVRERTGGRGVAIFVDHIGAAVIRATIRALARQGVLTTAGWKSGMNWRSVRAVDCIQRHVHVHTHYARYGEARSAMQNAETTGWVPPLREDGAVCPWSEIPTLAHDYAQGRVTDYFPLYEVNAQ
jgi:NADPH:quinone reductase-like Zn-dependent oxidoreductase